jgi:hypothetical protein
LNLIYSAHLRNRLRLRNIPDDLPREIVETATERFFDKETNYYIAIKPIHVYDRLREVMVACEIERDSIRLITIHPVKQGQKANRIKSGRWVIIHERFQDLLR